MNMGGTGNSIAMGIVQTEKEKSDNGNHIRNKKKQSQKVKTHTLSLLPLQSLCLSSLLHFILHFCACVFLFTHLQPLPMFPQSIAQSYSILKSKVLGHVLLLILKQLHMPPHTSATLSNPQSRQVHYSSLLNFTFTIPLELLSQDCLIHLTSDSETSLGLFTYTYCRI